MIKFRFYLLISIVTTEEPKNLTRKQQKELEAAAWLAQNSSELDADIDTQLGLSTVDDGKLIKAALADLPI